MDELIGRLGAKIGVGQAAAAKASVVVAQFERRNIAHARGLRADTVAHAIPTDSDAAGLSGETHEYAYEQAGRNAVGIFAGAIPGFGQFV